MIDIPQLLESEKFKTNLEELCHEIWASAITQLFNGSCHDVDGVYVIPKATVEVYKFWVNEEILNTDSMHAQKILQLIEKVSKNEN